MIPVSVKCHVCHDALIETEVGPDSWDETRETCPSCGWTLLVGVTPYVRLDVHAKPPVSGDGNQ